MSTFSPLVPLPFCPLPLALKSPHLFLDLVKSPGFWLYSGPFYASIRLLRTWSGAVSDYARSLKAAWNIFDLWTSINML